MWWTKETEGVGWTDIVGVEGTTATTGVGLDS